MYGGQDCEGYILLTLSIDITFCRNISFSIFYLPQQPDQVCALLGFCKPDTSVTDTQEVSFQLHVNFMSKIIPSCDTYIIQPLFPKPLFPKPMQRFHLQERKKNKRKYCKRLNDSHSIKLKRVIITIKVKEGRGQKNVQNQMNSILTRYLKFY